MNTILLHLIDFIEHHKNISYLILFLGSMFESVFPFSFFLYGEIFFLTGSILAGMGILNIFIIVPLILTAGILGDNVSYLHGYYFHNHYLVFFLKNKQIQSKTLNEKIQKVKTLFSKYGGIIVFLARFGGPLARITPYIAGSLKLRYRNFIVYELPGAIGGIGIFLFIGYYFSKNYEKIIHNFFTYFYIFLLIIGVLFLIYKFLKTKIPLYFK